MSDDYSNSIEALLHRSLRGDDQAYLDFLQMVAESRRSFIRAHRNDLPPEEIERALQDLLIFVHRKRQTWKCGSSANNWLDALFVLKLDRTLLRKESPQASFRSIWRLVFRLSSTSEA